MAGQMPDGDEGPPASQHHSLKYHLLGPSLTKAGQDSVDQKKVSEIIYSASVGSKYFNNEESKDKVLTQKIERILLRKRQLERLDLSADERRADRYIEELELTRDLSQSIVHVDCDAFYAAVEELDRPELKHVPFAVGQGVLTTCNYVARKYGCRSAMAGFVAKKLCPELVCLPLNFAKYTAKAKEVRAILADYDPRFESASLDEAYLNITQFCAEHDDMDPQEAVAQLRDRVERECKITVSAGIGANAKLAKICSNKNKPNGQFYLPSTRTAIMEFMRDLPTRKVNGIGRVLERELDAIGIRTCGDIYASRCLLPKLFGDKAFEFLMQTYLGIGRTNVRPSEEYERKSVGTESTFHDISGRGALRAKLRRAAEELEGDLTRTGFKGRTLVLKVKLHTYEVLTRQMSPPFAVSKAEDLYRFAEPMLDKLEKEMKPATMTLRLMGLRCTHLVSTKKPDRNFFGSAGQELTVPKRRRISNNVDEDGWEVWPDEEFEQAAQQERDDEIGELQQLSQEVEDAAEHDGARDGDPTEDVASMPTTSSESTSWSCPICSRPQAANDKSFNEHIDHCLSKQTIKDAVRDTSEDANEPNTGEVPSAKRKNAPSEAGQRRGKQPKLFFK